MVWVNIKYYIYLIMTMLETYKILYKYQEHCSFSLTLNIASIFVCA